MNQGQKYTGKIAIRCGNPNQPPRVVFVKGINTWDSAICECLNTGETYFSAEEGSDLIDFNFEVFERLTLEWKVARAKRNFECLSEDLKNLNEGNKD